jgi:hypothetical protein
MAFRLTYQVQVAWLGPGIGVMGGGLAPGLPQVPASGAQVIEFQNAQGGQVTNTFLTADVTTLTNAMAADIAAQLNVGAVLARIQGFSSGTG